MKVQDLFYEASGYDSQGGRETINLRSPPATTSFDALATNPSSVGLQCLRLAVEVPRLCSACPREAAIEGVVSTGMVSNGS